MDTVLSLSKPEDDADKSAIRMEFRKARLRTPETADQFAPLLSIQMIGSFNRPQGRERASAELISALSSKNF